MCIYVYIMCSSMLLGTACDKDWGEQRNSNDFNGLRSIPYSVSPGTCLTLMVLPHYSEWEQFFKIWADFFFFFFTAILSSLLLFSLVFSGVWKHSAWVSDNYS